MTPLHIDTLVALRAAAQLGLPVDLLLTDLRRGRHPQLSADKLERTLRDLADARLAALETAAIGTRWRLTAHGASALEEGGL